MPWVSPVHRPWLTTNQGQKTRLATQQSGVKLGIMQNLAVLCVLGLALGCYHSAHSLAQPPEFDTLDAAAKRNLVQHAGFVFDLFTADRPKGPSNGFAVAGTVDSDAFLSVLGGNAGYGAAVVLLDLGPCAGNTPHIHPRGTEVSTILRGTLQFGYVEENAGGNRLVVVDAKPGQVVFIPQGLMHFEHNLECTTSNFVANFGTNDPGTQTIWSSLLQIPTPFLAASLNIDDCQEKSEAIIEGWKRRQLVSSPATGGAECLARCNISYQQANTFTGTSIENKPIVPTDQKGNKQSFAYGHVNNEGAQRCDFVGLSLLGANPGAGKCVSVESTPTGYRRLMEAAHSIKDKLPQDRITVMNVKQALQHAQAM